MTACYVESRVEGFSDIIMYINKITFNTIKNNGIDLYKSQIQGSNLSTV